MRHYGSLSLTVRLEQSEGVSIFLQSPEGLSIAQVVNFAFAASNNEAEYEAVLLEL